MTGQEPMHAVIHVNNAAHQKAHAAWMKAGLERHGWSVDPAPAGVPRGGDLVVVWGWRQRAVIDAARGRGVPVLVMERGHIQPRMEWTSCGFDGLGNRGRYPAIDDGGLRWRANFSHHLRPWRDAPDGHVLICGQVIGDAALWGVDFHRWAQDATDLVRAQHQPVRYRPHPLSLRSGDRWCPDGAAFSEAPLGEDLAGAAFAVTYNSTAGVEAVLAGVPTIVTDEGGMAWPVAGHAVGAPPPAPDRTAWTHRLAWTQWRGDELADGTAWEALRTCL